MPAINTGSMKHADYAWDPDTVTKILVFFITFINLNFLSHFLLQWDCLRGLTVKLQKGSKDILQAYDQVSDVQLELELMKENCKEEFRMVWRNWSICKVSGYSSGYAKNSCKAASSI